MLGKAGPSRYPRGVKLAFFGTPAFAVPSLEGLVAAGHEIKLVVTNPDRPQGRSKAPIAPPVKEAALARGLALHQPAAVKGDRRLETLGKELAIELGVVVAYGQFLPKAVRESPRLGFMINLHASLLPRWRGAAPIASALRAGDSVTGVSIQRIEKELDAGPVLASREEPITATDTRATLEERLARIGADLLVDSVAKIARGWATFTPQDSARATHVGKIETPDAKIDILQPGIVLERLVRAMNPDPIAWLDLPSGRLQVLKASFVPFSLGDSTDDAPGTIAGVEGEALLVRTGEGSLALEVVKPAGKREMSGAAYARGKRLGPGSTIA
jgi:methionyl-tRNA formyltransferase